MYMYFNEKFHKYTDELDNAYISATTLIGKYEDKFDEEGMAKRCARIGKNPNHPKYLKYKDKSEKQIILEWNEIRDTACDLGNERHNYLEQSIKISTGYKLIENTNFINDRIYTIPDILENHSYGVLDLDSLAGQGIREEYPQIYKDLVLLKEKGWRIYSEICTFSHSFLVSGLIDILAVKGNKFMILDWKTNRADIRFESGYFVKDNDGNITTEFKRDFAMFKYPIHHLEQSTGNKYTLQLSLYDFLTEEYGLQCVGNLLYHIRHEEYDKSTAPSSDMIGKRIVDKIPISYFKNEISSMINHYNKDLIKNGQHKMFYNK